MDTIREIEWAAPKEASSLFVAMENAPEEHGPWQGPDRSERQRN